MMIHFSENIFGAKTLLSFVFTGPNSAHPEVFRHANHNGTSFKAVWWSIYEKTHFGLRKLSFGAKTSLSFVVHLQGHHSEGQHPEVFRHANHNGTSFKAVWWSIYEKTHFSLKHHFPLYLQGQTQHTLRFSGMPIAMVQVSKLYDDPFLRKHIWG